MLVPALAAGLALGYIIRQKIAARSADSIESKIKRELAETESKSRELLIEAKNKAVKILEDAKVQERERLGLLARQEDRLNLQTKKMEQRESELEQTKKEFENQTNQVKAAKEEAENLKAKTAEMLEQVSGLSREEGRAQLLRRIEEESQEALLSAVKKMEQHRVEELEKKANEIMTSAIQRYARSHVSEMTTSVFTLPSEDLKGKIIGREGRNIRTIERLTGVELIIDETPETIIISSFDPVRREIARLALQKLIKDGRIQPAKIEEKVEEAKAEIDKRIFEIGEEAAYEVGILGLPKEIIQLLGRLSFRTSFGQNVLTHSVEMAHLSGMMAAELGANVEVTKAGALLHDIGKAIDHEVPGTHVELGRKILKKYGISDEIIAAMESHHEEYPFSTPESFIVAAADILSAARPGARRGTLENYLKRLEDLEKIAMDFEGVKQAYALSAGREIRVFVVPEKIDDFRALQLARDIANKVESELKYPGEIKVNVIRESRAVEYAR